MVTTACHRRQRTVPASHRKRAPTGRCPGRDNVLSLAVCRRYVDAQLLRSDRARRAPTRLARSGATARGIRRSASCVAADRRDPNTSITWPAPTKPRSGSRWCWRHWPASAACRKRVSGWASASHASTSCGSRCWRRRWRAWSRNRPDANRQRRRRRSSSSWPGWPRSWRPRPPSYRPPRCEPRSP